MSQSELLGRPVWCELLTTDMKAAEAFYTTVIGWTVAPFDPNGGYDIVKRPGDGRGIGGVMKIPEGMNFPPHWAMYLGVPNLDAVVAQVKKLGGSTLSELHDMPEVGRFQALKDPQGAVFSILEPAPSSPETPETEPEPGDVSWRELYTTDAAGAVRFYSEVFGWHESQAMDMGPMGKYHIVARSFDIAGVMNKPKEMAHAPTAWGLYFRVNGLDAAIERVKKNGGQITNGPMEVPGGDRIVNCVDPQGAMFSLHERKC
jgi:predicted enzyme related to lactoylglutathione lyase